MLVKVKPHSSLSKFFSDTELSVDLVYYKDLVPYLMAMQPKFIHYLHQQHVNSINEGYVFLDEKLNEVSLDSFDIIKVKSTTVIHIVPAIVGGGGKRGFLIALLAIAFIFAAPALLGGAAAAGGSGGLFAGAFGKIGTFLKTMPSWIKTIAVNVGLGLLSALFSPKPKAGESTRNNDMFGSLSNSTGAGTPVALHYGLVRAAGQLISGYISSIPHSKNDTITVDGTLVSGDTSSGVTNIMSINFGDIF